MANFTFVEPLSAVEAREVFNGRLAALSIADSTLADAAWKGAPLTKIIQRELAGFSNHLNLSGSDIVVNRLAARQFALSAHELQRMRSNTALCQYRLDASRLRSTLSALPGMGHSYSCGRKPAAQKFCHRNGRGSGA